MFEVWRMGEMRETSSSYRAAHCDGSIGRWSQCSESSTDSSVQACEGETDRCTGSGKGKYEPFRQARMPIPNLCSYKAPVGPNSC